MDQIELDYDDRSHARAIRFWVNIFHDRRYHVSFLARELEIAHCRWLRAYGPEIARYRVSRIAQKCGVDPCV